MRFSTLTTATLLLQPLTSTTALPHDESSLQAREATTLASIPEPQVLEKRRGGGGGGGRGGGSSGSSGSTGSSGSGRGGTGSSGTTSTGVRGGGTTSSSPGYTSGGSGVYAGGAASPYRAGGVLPRTGAAPIFLGGAAGFAAGALIFGGHPFYYYGPYGYHYPYYNNQTRQNQSLPISCVCAEYNPCGCDDIDSSDVVDEQLDDGTANITTINGTQTVVINGTLENGTEASSAIRSGQNGGMMGMVWPVAVMVGAMIYGL